MAGTPIRRRAAGGAVRVIALVAALAVGLAACGSRGGSDAGSGGSGSGSAAPTTTITTTTGDAAGAALDVAVVADSEVPAEVVDQLDALDGIEITSRVTEPGWTVEQLDDGFDAALASKPDVLVYSAGANDLLAQGIGGMLDLLEARVERARGETCVVYVIPAVDTDGLEEPTRSQAVQLLAAFEDVVRGWGVSFVSYPDLAAAMADDGQTFFAEGELGSFHPGTQSYDRIAQTIAEEVDSCR